MKETKIVIGGLALWAALNSCGGSGGAVGGTETGNTVGAVVASIFDREEETSSRRPSIPWRLALLLVREARAQGGPTSACDVIAQGAEEIAMSPSVVPGTYGVVSSPGDFVTLTAEDGCDRGGDYASWEVTSRSMSCTDSRGAVSRITMTDSTGVFRETGTASDIYGTFNVSDGEGEITGIDCHFTVSHSETGPSARFSVAVCVDRSGSELAQAEDTTCTDD